MMEVAIFVGRTFFAHNLLPVNNCSSHFPFHSGLLITLPSLNELKAITKLKQFFLKKFMQLHMGGLGLCLF